MEAVENEMPGGIKLLKASEDYYDTVKRDLRILEAEQLNLRTDADVLVTRQIKIRRLAKTAIFAACGSVCSISYIDDTCSK